MNDLFENSALSGAMLNYCMKTFRTHMQHCAQTLEWAKPQFKSMSFILYKVNPLKRRFHNSQIVIIRKFVVSSVGIKGADCIIIVIKDHEVFSLYYIR